MNQQPPRGADFPPFNPQGNTPRGAQFGPQGPSGQFNQPGVGPGFTPPQQGAPRDSQGRFVASNQGSAQSKPKKKHGPVFWVLVIVGAIVLISILANLGGGSSDSKVSAPAQASTSAVAQQPATTAAAPATTAAAPTTTTQASAKTEAPVKTEAAAPKLPAEHAAALAKAKSYVKYSHFSYAKLYGQLTSEYGEKFPADAAQYAVDNVGADWNAEALEAAQSYRKTMSMSNEQIREQLTSEYGEQFTPEQADYAIAHLPA